MKLIVAILHGEDLGPVQSTLYALGVEQMAVSQVLVRASDRGRTLIYRSSMIRVPFESRLRVEIIVDDERADAVVATLLRVGFFGESDPIGTGRIVVRPWSETPAGQCAVLAN